MDAVIVLGFIAAGLALVAVASFLKLELGEISKASLLAFPLIAYLVLIGKVGEFEGLGVKAKFSAISEGMIVEPAKLADLLISSQEANNPNFVVDMLKRPCRPYYVVGEQFLPTQLTDDHKEQVRFVALQIRNSILCGVFKGLVIVDERFQPIGVLEASAIQEILRIRLTARNLRLVTQGVTVTSPNPFSEIIATELGLALTNPRFQAEGHLAKHVAVNSDATVEQTYADLLLANAHVASITDRRGRFIGIVTKEAIEGWILTQLISTSQKGNQ